MSENGNERKGLWLGGLPWKLAIIAIILTCVNCLVDDGQSQFLEPV